MSAAAGSHGGASAYAAGLQFATALRSAAAQQQQHAQQQQQQQLKDQFETELKLRKDGYTPYMQPGETKSSGLKTRDPQPGVDPSRVIRDHFGRAWVAPDPKAKPEATPQQTYTDLQSALDKGGQTVSPEGNVHQMTTTPRYQADENNSLTPTGASGVNVPVPDQSRVLTPPGSKQGIYMPTGEEKAATTLQEQLTAQNAKDAAKPGASHIDTEHFSSPMLIDPKTGKASAIALPDGVTHNDKPDKPDKWTYSHFTNDAGKVTHTRTGEGGAQQWNGKEWAPMEAGAAIGPKRKDPDAPNAPRPATPAQLNSMDAKKRAGFVRAELQFKRAMAAATVNGYVDDDKVKEAKDALLKAKQDVQDGWEESAQKFGISAEHVDYASQEEPDAPPPQQTGGGRGAPGATAAASKTASLTDVRAYAAKNGITEAEALRKVKAEGFTVK